MTLTEDGVEFTGSDLELTIRAKVPAETTGRGAPCWSPACSSTRSRSWPRGRESRSSSSEDQAKIEAGRFRSELRTLAAADFPRLPEPEGDSVKVAGNPLAEGLRQVVPAASRDDARPILTGVLIAATAEGVRLVTTDSYRLAVRDLPGDHLLPEGRTVLVGAKGLGELQRLLGDGDVEVFLGERYVTFRARRRRTHRRGSSRVTSRTTNSSSRRGTRTEWPWTRDALTSAVERVSLVGGNNRDSAPIRLAMSADGLELSATAQDVGQSFEPVEAKFEGTDVTVAFNSRFLLDGVEAAASAEVTIETTDPLKPAVLRGSEAGDFLYLLMPVRIA